MLSNASDCVLFFPAATVFHLEIFNFSGKWMTSGMLSLSGCPRRVLLSAKSRMSSWFSQENIFFSCCFLIHKSYIESKQNREPKIEAWVIRTVASLLYTHTHKHTYFIYICSLQSASHLPLWPVCGAKKIAKFVHGGPKAI